MKNVVFKMKFNHPNKKTTPKLNVNHFEYICKRPRALCNENRSFCCFGKVSEIGYKSFGEIDEFEKMKEHILQKSKEKTTFYKCVISLEEQDALEKGFEKRLEWEKLMKIQMSKIAKNMGIKVEDFEYVCSVHMEKGHPHMHFMAWDKEQEIQRERITPYNLNNIRKLLTNYVFRDELQGLFEHRTKNKQNFKESLKDSFSGIENIFQMSDDEYKKYTEEIKSLDLDTSNSKIFNIALKKNFLNDIMKEIYEFRKILPKNGRLNYGFMDTQTKKHIDMISKKILSNNIELRSSFSNYMDSVKRVVEFSSKSEKFISKTVKDAENELLKFIGNQILDVCKKIGKKEFDIERSGWEKRKQDFERQEMIGIISNLVSFMTKSENKNKNVEKQVINSITAKKDLARRLENKSVIDWER